MIDLDGSNDDDDDDDVKDSKRGKMEMVIYRIEEASISTGKG